MGVRCMDVHCMGVSHARVWIGGALVGGRAPWHTLRIFAHKPRVHMPPPPPGHHTTHAHACPPAPPPCPPQVIMALTEDNKLRVPELMSVLRLVQGDVQLDKLVQGFVRGAPQLSRQVLLGWADRVLVS